MGAGGGGVHLGGPNPVDDGAEGIGDVDVPVGGDGLVVDEGRGACVGDGVGGDELPGVRVDEEVPGEGAGDQQAVAGGLDPGGLGTAVLAARQEGFEDSGPGVPAVDGAVGDARGVDVVTVGRDALGEGAAAVDRDRVGGAWWPWDGAAPA
jgi:hypothetical protein